MPEQIPTPEDQMIQWITSKWITKSIYVISELGIPDLLSNGPLSVDFLSEKTDTHPHFIPATPSSFISWYFRRDR